MTFEWPAIAFLLGLALVLCVGLSVLTCCILIVGLCVSLFFNYKHGLIILDVEDAISESLDMLDERYRSISKVLQKDVFFDSPEVRQVLADIEGARMAVLRVANSLARIDSSSVETRAMDGSTDES